MEAPSLWELPSCPVPHIQHERVVLGHGSGGTLSARLLRDVFLSQFENPVLAALEDQAVVSFDPARPGSADSTAARLAFTTDSFVVKPIFFPGGDIGSLAVHGTINDL